MEAFGDHVEAAVAGGFCLGVEEEGLGAGGRSDPGTGKVDEFAGVKQKCQGSFFTSEEAVPCPTRSHRFGSIGFRALA